MSAIMKRFMLAQVWWMAAMSAIPAEGSDKGYGRMNIRARAEELGAHLSISSLPDGGTRVFLSLRIRR